VERHHPHHDRRGPTFDNWRRVELLSGESHRREVYKTRDTRLDRSVAIEILPPEVSADPDRRARFEREAKTIMSPARH